jgi:hypothetical protein
MRLVSFWLQGCLESHLPCETWAGNTTPPTRLININDPMRPFLQCPPYGQGGYVALSYKWGCSKRYLSVVVNIKDHYREIPLDVLPKTFTDAIQVAHNLGFRYLWIDALCIIQDLPEDRSREISRMGDIFRASTLTLFAQAGDDVDAGLSRIRDPRRTKPCKLTIRTTLEDCCVIESTYAVLDLQSHGADHPLQKRGWVLQEEVLASRALCFGDEQLEWRCHCSTLTETLWEHTFNDFRQVRSPQTAEDWGEVYNHPAAHSGLRMLLRLQYQSPTLLPSWVTCKFTRFGEWYKCVGKYSQRKLTFASDVLPALAGIATILSNTQEIHYVNGLWEDDLAFGLLWYVEPPSETSTALWFNQTADLSTVPEGADIPSWTWVSRWGMSIKFFARQVLHARKMANVALEHDYQMDRQGKDCTSKYQEITSRSLLLTGYVITGVVDHENRGYERFPSLRPPESAWVRDFLSPETQKPIGYVALDADPITAPVHEITGLACAASPVGSSDCVLLVSVALVHVGGNQYARVGLMFEEVLRKKPFELMVHSQLPQGDWWEGRRKRTITLV